MGLTTVDKKKIIKEHQTEKDDTGSPEVQIALLTAKVKKLAQHLKKNRKDVHSRRGLISMLAKRKRLLYYLLGKSEERHGSLIKKLEL